MRGEDAPSGWGGTQSGGSPPHARGRRPHVNSSGVVAGITPACAGKTLSGGIGGAATADHPRMRGEDTIRAAQQHYGQGSPPHARGRRSHMNSGGIITGITPACAGKTPTALSNRRGQGDHPRMRGEDMPNSIFSPTSLGSPPHARGRLFFVVVAVLAVGITPACAGKTMTSEYVVWRW